MWRCFVNCCANSRESQRVCLGPRFCLVSYLMAQPRPSPNSPLSQPPPPPPVESLPSPSGDSEPSSTRFSFTHKVIFLGDDLSWWCSFMPPAHYFLQSQPKSGHSNICWGDFSGGPVVRTPSFHCRGHRFDPWLGELRSHMQKKKKTPKKPSKQTYTYKNKIKNINTPWYEEQRSNVWKCRQCKILL